MKCNIRLQINFAMKNLIKNAPQSVIQYELYHQKWFGLTKEFELRDYSPSLILARKIIISS